jgi:hypothetical protein
MTHPYKGTESNGEKSRLRTKERLLEEVSMKSVANPDGYATHGDAH